jgi:hypothetical protein
MTPSALRRGNTDAALRAVEEALAGGVARGERLSEAELYGLKGEALLARPAPNAPEACFQRALTIARVQDAKGWELRAALSFARLWRSQGRGSDARQLVAESAAWFTEGHDTTDLLPPRFRGAEQLTQAFRVAMLSVQGVDMVQFGPADYSMSIGLAVQWDHPRLQEAEAHVIRTALRLGVAPWVEIDIPIGRGAPWTWACGGALREREPASGRLGEGHALHHPSLRRAGAGTGGEALRSA